MRKLLSILVLMMFVIVAKSQTYNAPFAGIPINKAMAPAQQTPMDSRTMLYDGSNFLYRAFKDTQEVITYLNLPKYRWGNAVYIVDSGGTLNGNGTYTNFHATFWMFADGVADVNLVKLNWRSGGGGTGCATCFATSTQLSDSSFTLNRPNLTRDSFFFDLNSILNITSLNNGLTLTGTLGQLGGPLVQNTVINGGAKSLAISGNSFQEGEGATISAAAVLTPGLDGNTFQVIGSSAINDISITNIQGGTHVGFIFTGTPTLSNNVAGPAGSAPMLLAGSVNYTAATGDYIEFVYDAINVAWHETARKLSGSGGVYTFSSGLTELPATQVKLGGTLTQPTTIAGNGFPTFFSGGRLEPGMGIPILAAGDLVTGNDGILFHVTGTTQINAINNQNWQAGSEIGFIFDNIVTLKNNTVGGVNTSPMLLAGRVDYTSAVGDYIGFKYDGVNFYETERKLAGSTTSVTANNGLTATSGNIQLGGTLVQSTTITSGTFPLIIDGSGGAPTNTIQAINTTNTAVKGQTTSGNAVFGIATTGVGGQFNTTSGASAIQAFSTNGQAVNLGNQPASTNNVVTLMTIGRGTSGSAANGIGLSIDMGVTTTTTANQPSNQIISKWTDATDATRTSQLSFTGVNNGTIVTKLSIGGASTFLTGTRFEVAKGVAVASTGNLTLGTDGNVFHITGTTTINAITTQDWQAGSTIKLIFDASLTVKNNTAGGAGTAVMLLAGGADFSATSNDVLVLLWDGTSFFEQSRSVN